MSRYFNSDDLTMGPKVDQYASHMVMTNVSQETHVKYINIDSKFRDDYDSVVDGPVDFMVTLPEPVNQVQSIEVENVEMPISYYNVSSALGNSYFTIRSFLNTVEQATYTITVPNGDYATIGDLVTAINIAIDNALPAGYDRLEFAFDNNRANFYVNNVDTNNTYNYIVNFAVDSTGNFDKYNFKGKFGWMLGFTGLTYDTADTSLPLNSMNFPVATAENFYDLTRPRVLYLYLDEYSQTKRNSFLTAMARSRTSNNVIAKIIVDRATHGFATMFPANDKNGFLLSDTRRYDGKCDIKRFNVQLLDEFDRKIDLNGLDFSFSLKITHK